MKRFYFILLVALLYGVAVSAQGVSSNEIAKEICEVAANTKSIQCDFVQTKQLKMLNDKMVSYGKLYYQQTNKMRWEYTSPYQYTFVINNSDVLIKKDERTDKINVNQSKVFKEIARIMMNCVLGKALSDDHSFKVSVVAGTAEWIATLVPQNKDMRNMFDAIILHFDRKNKMVSSVELAEPNGDKTTIELRNLKTNVSIPASTFSVD